MWQRDDILDALGVFAAQIVTYVVVMGAISLIVIGFVLVFTWLSVILMVLVPVGYATAIILPTYLEWRDDRRRERAKREKQQRELAGAKM